MDSFATAMVCVDCYFAHHYGYMEVAEGVWAVGPDGVDTTERRPLALLDEVELADNTDSNADSDTGIDDFSWSSCDGCGSTLGGARYRLALFALDPS